MKSRTLTRLIIRWSRSSLDQGGLSQSGTLINPSTAFAGRLSGEWRRTVNGLRWNKGPSASASDAQGRSSLTPDGEYRTLSGTEMAALSKSSVLARLIVSKKARLSLQETMLLFSSSPSVYYLTTGLAEWQGLMLGQNFLTSCVVSGKTIYLDPQFSNTSRPGERQRLKAAEQEISRTVCGYSPLIPEPSAKPSQEPSSFFAKKARLLLSLVIRPRALSGIGSIISILGL